MHMPKVSVIFPMYNVAGYVGDSLRSVLEQTYRDFELIAVNDGATDNTMEIFRDTMARFGDGAALKLIEKENGGLADARNAGLLHAEGEYVVFIDSDDVMHPRYLETLVGDAERFGAELSASTYKIVSKEALFSFEETVPGELIDRSELMMCHMLRKCFLIGCWTLLIKRDLIVRNGLCFNTDVKFSVDQAFIWKVMDLAGKISVNRSKLYHYYLRPGSIMTAAKKADLYSGAEHFTSVVGTLRNLPVNKDILINRWKIGVLHTAAQLVSFDEYREVRKKLDLRYRDCLAIPDPKIKASALMGMVSERTLYRVFAKNTPKEG